MRSTKFVLFTNGFTRVVEPLFKSHHTLVGIVEGAPRVLVGRKDNLLEKIKNFYRHLSTKKSLQAFCKKNNIPYFDMKTGNDIMLSQFLMELQPDVIVIYSLSRLLKPEIFEIPKYGTINLHPSLLPQYRGPNPWFWTYFNQDEVGGVTVHFIDKGEDTGDIISQRSYRIPRGIRSPEMQDIAIGKIGNEMLIEALDKLPNCSRERQPDIVNVMRARNIRLEEHKRLINWEDLSVESVWHILRGTESWLNALSQPEGWLTGQRWEVLSYEKCDTSLYRPSEIYQRSGRSFVACKDGIIFVKVKVRFKVLILYFLNRFFLR